MNGLRVPKTVKVLSEIKSNISIQYVKVICKECGASWGISVRDGQITERDLICRNCVTEKYWNDGRDI